MSDESAEDNDGLRLTRESSSRSKAGRSEFDFIERLRQQELARLGLSPTRSSLVTRHSSLLQGIGDDAAILRPRAGFDTVITADLLVEGVDFDLENFNTPARDLGHKALAVSLSDVAAMGARPTACLLSVGLPRALWRGHFLEEFYEGLRALASVHGVAVAGGDISRTPVGVVIDSVVLGEVRRGRAVLRSGARSGDLIFVTGSLGGAAAGLRTLQERARSRKKAKLTRAQKQLALRQTRPTPRVEWGLRLGEKKLATAMIDLSDGLSSDLAHLCRESGVGATIDAARLPLDPLLRAAGVDDEEALRLALDGGEDFELLFTVRPRDAAKLPDEVGGVPVTHVGEVTGEAGKMKLTKEALTRSLKPGGFRHF